MKLQSKLPHTGTTIFTVMSNLANDHGAINLSQGFPDFDVDQRLLDLVSKYMRSGNNQYAPMQGVWELRQRIAAVFEIRPQLTLAHWRTRHHRRNIPRACPRVRDSAQAVCQAPREGS